MESFKEHELPESDIEAREGELHPLAEHELQMVQEKLGGDAEHDEEGGGILSRLPKGAIKQLRAMMAATALMGAFELGIRPETADAEDHRGRYTELSDQEAYDKAYQRAHDQAAKQYQNRERQSVQNTGRNDGQRDAVLGQDLNAVANQAYQEEVSRIEAQRARQLENYARQVGRARARFDANQPRHGLAALFLGIVNAPNRVISGAIDSAIDGE